MPSWDLLWGEIYNLLDLDLRRSFLNHLVAMETVTIRLNQPFKLMEQIFIINYIALFRSDNSCIETSSNNSRVVQPEWCIGQNIGLHRHNLLHSKALHAEIVGISPILFLLGYLPGFLGMCPTQVRMQSPQLRLWLMALDLFLPSRLHLYI